MQKYVTKNRNQNTPPIKTGILLEEAISTNLLLGHERGDKVLLAESIGRTVVFDFDSRRRIW